MLNHKDNDLICRVGPGTPMGKAHRRHWLPACQVSDLDGMDGAPRHVRLLGEDFVLFRTPEGVLGFLDDKCPHRGVSLTTGRVEQGGLRCIFHGWKFAPDGDLLETPNEPNPDFKKGVQAKSYPVVEAGGLIWVYIGPPDKMPTFPRHRWMDVDQRHRINAYLVENSNYVQVLEAFLDSSHVNILHQDAFKTPEATQLDFGKTVGKILSDSAPEISVKETEFGFHTAAIRYSGTSGKKHLRITAYIAPFQIYNANGDLWSAVVPIDDEHCVYYSLWWNPEIPIGEDPHAGKQLRFVGMDKRALTDFSLTYETANSRDKPSYANGFLQDREAMRRGWSFSGFHSFTQEDAGVIMSAGPIKDRSNEHLCSGDAPIRYMYRTLLQSAKAVEDGGDPIGVAVDPMHVRGIEGLLDADDHWQTLVADQRVPERVPL